jgi:DNA-binding IscR family transcriptional regulator
MSTVLRLWRPKFRGVPGLRCNVNASPYLSCASLIASTRGAAGGDRLARSPHEITLAEVIEVMDGDDRPDASAAPSPPLARALLEIRRELHESQRERLESATLADLVELAAGREPMWYI